MKNLKEFLASPITLLIDPDPRLRVKCAMVTEINPELLISLKEVMQEIMIKAGGIGLAAPQVGLHLRIILILELMPESKNLVLMVNPEILKKSGDACIAERCLSISDQEVLVPRSQEIEVQYLNEHGEVKRKQYSGINAICVQHEIDHLDGILMTDYLSR